jgi:hypothetical protein
MELKSMDPVVTTIEASTDWYRKLLNFWRSLDSAQRKQALSTGVSKAELVNWVKIGGEEHVVPGELRSELLMAYCSEAANRFIPGIQTIRDPEEGILTITAGHKGKSAVATVPLQLFDELLLSGDQFKYQQVRGLLQPVLQLFQG